MDKKFTKLYGQTILVLENFESDRKIVNGSSHGICRYGRTNI